MVLFVPRHYTLKKEPVPCTLKIATQKGRSYHHPYFTEEPKQIDSLFFLLENSYSSFKTLLGHPWPNPLVKSVVPQSVSLGCRAPSPTCASLCLPTEFPVQKSGFLSLSPRSPHLSDTDKGSRCACLMGQQELCASPPNSHGISCREKLLSPF